MPTRVKGWFDRSLASRGALTMLIAGCVAMLAMSASATAAPSAVNTPIRTVSVSWGRIGYRALGRGQPLLLLQGSTISIDFWPPSFLDALAGRFRIFAPDYEVIGHTTLRAGEMTIPRLADDAADLIRALHLRRVNVLGLSIGTSVAEALAIRHPQLVRRVILCSAPGPGDGRAVAGSPAAIQVLLHPSLATAMPFLFPADRAAAARAFVRDIHRYRHFYGAPNSVARLQFAAGVRWFGGLDADGHRIAQIRVPVLLGAGADDEMTPPVNTRILEAELPHATVRIYPDAKHLFLFQDAPDWIARIEQFLGGLDGKTRPSLFTLSRKAPAGVESQALSKRRHDHSR